MTDITRIIEVIIAILAIVMSAIVIPLIKVKFESVRITKDKTALDYAGKWLEIAVQAAEEAARAGLINKQAKYMYAKTILERHDITFDTKTTEALINSTVWELFNQFKEESAVGGEDEEDGKRE